MEIPKEIREKFNNKPAADDRVDQAAKKKLASVHYKRRKLDKDVRKYIKENITLRGKEIERIGRRNGFYIT